MNIMGVQPALLSDSGPERRFAAAPQ